MPKWLTIQNRIINIEHVSVVEIIPEGQGNDKAAVIFLAGAEPISVRMRDWPTVKKALGLP